MNKRNYLTKRSYIEASKKFMRLAETTQVVFPRNGREETVKTRMSHSYEVMNSAMMLAESLDCGGLVIDYQKAIGNVCLLHDIGHPSFGHEGARIINEVFVGLGLKEGFDDNNNNLVVIEKEQLQLEPYDLASLIKYPEKLYKSQAKYLRMLENAIDEDIKYFSSKIKFTQRPKRTLACEIMDEADRNSYVCSDMTDFYSLGWGTSKEMLELFNSGYKSFEIKSFLSTIAKAIDEKDKGLIKRTFNQLKISLNENYMLIDNLQLEPINHELIDLREKLYEIEKALFIHHKLVKAQRAEHSEMLREYIQDVLEGYYPSRTYKEKIEKTKGLDKLRAIRDMLGETTDWYVQMYIKNKRSKS